MDCAHCIHCSSTPTFDDEDEDEKYYCHADIDTVVECPQSFHCFEFESEDCEYDNAELLFVGCSNE